MILAFFSAAVMAPQVNKPPCLGNAGLDVVCGVPVPEDIVPVPNSRWLVATSMPRDGSSGGLFLIDSRTLQARRVDFVQPASERRVPFATGRQEAAEVAKCSPLEPGGFISHGISLSKGKNGVHRLYVVGHGSREAIELFNVDARAPVPVVRWAGCVRVPKGVEGNSVVGLPGGGFMFTTLYDPDETGWPERIGKLASGAPAGALFEWHAHTGMTRLPIPPVSGPNGLAVSSDGKTIFLAGWGDRIVRRIDRKGKENAPPLLLDFLPDNLHWSPDGLLLAAGQPTTVQKLFACSTSLNAGAYCVAHWSVAKIDPATLTVTARLGADTEGVFGDSTSAVIAHGRLWLGSISNDRIGVVSLRGKRRAQ